MTPLGTLIILALLLFTIAYVSRRRFGILGLGLAAGALLSQYLAESVTPVIQQQGIVLQSHPMLPVVQVALVIAPPLLLFFSGPAYQATWQRIVGSLAFAVLALAILLPQLATLFELDDAALSNYTTISAYAGTVVVVGVIAALADTLLTKSVKLKKH